MSIPAFEETFTFLHRIKKKKKKSISQEFTAGTTLKSEMRESQNSQTGIKAGDVHRYV